MAMTLKGIRARFRQRGMTLIEVALALGVVTITLAGLASLLADNARALKSKAAANRMVEITKAAKGYVKANHVNLMAIAGSGTPVIIPAGRTSATASVPSGPSGLPSLQSGGYLPSSFVDTNGYGQHHAVLVRQPAANILEVMVTAYGGNPIPDAELGRVASMVGASGGFMAAQPVDTSSSGFVTGVGGGWRAPASTWSAGAMTPATGRTMSTLAFENGDLISDFLNRYDVGEPEANRMHTAVDVNGNDLNNVRIIRGAAGILRIEQDLEATGDLWSGQDVTATRNVTAGTNVTAGQDVAAGRDVAASRNVTASQDVSATRHVTAGQNLTTGQDATIGRNLLVNSGSTLVGAVTASNTVTAASNIVSTSGLVATGLRATANAGCSPNGAIAINAADGGLLFCQSGLWKTQGGGGVIGRLYGGGGSWGSFTCEPGYHQVGYHMNVGNTNNAFFIQCVKDGF